MFYFSPLPQVWISHLRSIGYEVVIRYVPIEFTINGPGTEYAKYRRHWTHIFPHGYTYHFFPTILLELRTNISVSLNSISICHICFLGELNSSPLQSECLIVLCGDLNVLYGGLRIRLYRINFRSCRSSIMNSTCHPRMSLFSTLQVSSLHITEESFKIQ